MNAKARESFHLKLDKSTIMLVLGGYQGWSGEFVKLFEQVESWIWDVVVCAAFRWSEKTETENGDYVEEKHRRRRTVNMNRLNVPDSTGSVRDFDFALVDGSYFH